MDNSGPGARRLPRLSGYRERQWAIRRTAPCRARPERRVQSRGSAGDGRVGSRGHSLPDKSHDDFRIRARPNPASHSPAIAPGRVHIDLTYVNYPIVSANRGESFIEILALCQDSLLQNLLLRLTIWRRGRV